MVSGTKEARKRTGMQKLLGFARPGDTWVLRIDQLGRSLLDVHELRDRDIVVQSIFDGIDPATTTGRLMLNRHGTLASTSGS